MAQAKPGHKKTEFSLSWLVMWMLRFCNVHLPLAITAVPCAQEAPQQKSGWENREVPAGTTLLDTEQSMRAQNMLLQLRCSSPGTAGGAAPMGCPWTAASLSSFSPVEELLWFLLSLILPLFKGAPSSPIHQSI